MVLANLYNINVRCELALLKKRKETRNPVKTVELDPSKNKKPPLKKLCW